MRTLDRAGLRESVRRELEQLFNTRCPIPSHRLPVGGRTVIDYGIPDFGTFSARNFNDHSRLADELRRAVEAYEPRLANVRVHVEPRTGDDMALTASIEAVMLTEDVPEAVLFVTMLQLKDGKAEVGHG